MAYSFAAIAAGLALLLVGAEGLVRGSAALALRLGLTPLVVGLTVVAFGTSSPELVVSLQATLAGRGAISIGNVVGSNISNFALILGCAALVRPLKVQAQLIRQDIPLVIAASVLLALLLIDGRLSTLEGALLTLGIVAYTAFNVRQARNARGPILEEFAEGLPPATGSFLRHLAFVTGGLALLIGGAHLLVDGAVAVAERLGISEAMIGLTIIAVGTSLPELATTLVAAMRGEGDLAIGNVVGSNVFNLLGILGPSALVRPLLSAGIGWPSLGVMIGTALLMLPLMRSGFCLNRWEGLLLIVVYTGYIGYLVTSTVA